LVRDQKRIILAKEVVKKNNIQFFHHKLSGRTKLAQALEMLDLGSRLTFNLASINKVDPAKTPWVDWFKKKLG